MSERRVRCSGRGRRAFTLVEVLVILVILGVLAAIVSPEFASAAEDTQAGGVAASVLATQDAIDDFRDRRGRYPTLAELRRPPRSPDLGRSFGALIDAGLLVESPVNPANGSSAVAASAASDVGWHYDAETGVIGATYFDEAAGARTPTP